MQYIVWPHSSTCICHILCACAEQPTEAQIGEARAKAASGLVNIDDDERKRRIIFGIGLTVRPMFFWLQHKVIALACARPRG